MDHKETSVLTQRNMMDLFVLKETDDFTGTNDFILKFSLFSPWVLSYNEPKTASKRSRFSLSFIISLSKFG